MAERPGAAPAQEQLAAGMALLATVFADVRERALGELDLRPGACLLDAGCGAGELAIAVAPRVRPGGRVIGIDLDEPTIDRARAAAAAAGVEAEFQAGDIRDLPFADGEGRVAPIAR